MFLLLQSSWICAKRNSQELQQDEGFQAYGQLVFKEHVKSHFEGLSSATVVLTNLVDLGKVNADKKVHGKSVFLLQQVY